MNALQNEAHGSSRNIRAPDYGLARSSALRVGRLRQGGRYRPYIRVAAE